LVKKAFPLDRAMMRSSSVPQMLVADQRNQHLATLGKVDEEWLAEARQAQQRLIHAEHEADVARAAFHRAVQRLVLHGAEPQDVAAALGISDRQLYELAHKAGDSAR